MIDLATTLHRHVEYLASPELEGRAPGTPGGVAARRYVVEALTGAGVKPAGVEGFIQAIPADGANVLGMIAGNGDADRHIVVAAHYDHLGVIDGRMYPGADDNGSGVAVLIETARRLVERRHELERSVLIASFDAEEPPAFLTEEMGSIHWVANPTVPLDTVDAMVCLDLVGRPLGGPGLPGEVRDSVFVIGAERWPALGRAVDRVGHRERLHLRRIGGDLVPPLSDHYAFEESGIASAFLTVGRSAEYHTPDDLPHLLDYDKLADLVAALTDLVSIASALPGERVFVETPDDAATLATMRVLLEPLTDHSPDVAEVLDLIGGFEAQLAERGRLSNAARVWIGSIILDLEERLAGS